MQLKQVETFLTVAETGSFTKAGEKLFISSSAVAQQIGSLEADIGARLFHRTTHGVSLTPIGRYLSEEGRLLVEKGHEIRDHIENMRFEQEHCIVLGTSMWQNCSLFFSLWGKFVSEHEQYQLRTVRIRDEFRLHRQGEHPDLIESVRDGEPWQADYSFLELCTDRIVFAVPKSHPLAGLKQIDYAAMQPYTMVTAPENLSPELDRLARELSDAGMMITRAKRYDFPLFIECGINNWIVQIPEAWTYLLPNFQILPFETDYCHRYGFFYREPVKPPLRQFLEFAKHERDSR